MIPHPQMGFLLSSSPCSPLTGYTLVSCQALSGITMTPLPVNLKLEETHSGRAVVQGGGVPPVILHGGLNCHLSHNPICTYLPITEMHHPHLSGCFEGFHIHIRKGHPSHKLHLKNISLTLGQSSATITTTHRGRKLCLLI